VIAEVRPVSGQNHADTQSRGDLPGSPAEIEAAIAERRAHLAQTIDELVQRAQPKAIAQRSVLDAKQRFAAATRTEDGELRTERLAAIAAAALTLITLVTLLRRRRTRRTS
jgi:hypothetical protein